ncbi:MAG TPA: hypothetical protein VHU19_14290 [Pyrinomonadaceae bacterium]|jgi:hypothetical protein|nr:hypothetical protein [Pyrinomonadaceae bacterium]
MSNKSYTAASNKTHAEAEVPLVDVNTTEAAAAVAATGTVTLAGQPADGDTLTVNGVAFTFRNSPSGAHQVGIGASVAATLAALTAALTAAPDAGVQAATYADNGVSVLTVTDATPGAAGNAFTLARSGTNISVSGATLTGGTDAIADGQEFALPFSLRLSAPGGSVEAGTTAHPIAIRLVDAAGHAITFVSDGAGGWAIPVKTIA